MTELNERLDKAHEIDALREICAVPSISVGVFHEGRNIYTHSVGLRDVEKGLDATPETTYLLGSCSKGFLSASIGILVGEGKLSWDEPVSRYIPDFNPTGDPRIGPQATIRAALRHTIGLSRPQIFLLGPNCSIVAKEEDYVKFLNCARTENQAGQRFNSWWSYNNLSYGLVSLIVQKVTGKRYSDFLKERIIEPLALSSTLVSSVGLGPTSNRAHGYAKLENGDYTRLRSGDTYTREDHSPVLSFIGMQSSVVDLLKFSAAMMEAYGAEEAEQEGKVSANPLKQMSTIWRGQWTRPMDDGFDNQLAYCLGWYSGYMPTAGVGYMGTNHKVRNKDRAAFNSRYILGRDSPRRFFVAHQGNANGYSSAIYLFPDTNSAVVALSNGGNLGDASDFAAKIMIQALFDTKPHIDYLELAKEEAHLHRRWYQDVLVDWLANSDVMHKEADLEGYVGNYCGYNTAVNIFERKETGHLAITINGHAESQCDLEFYGPDAYSFQPRTRDEWLSKGMMDWEHYFVGVLKFSRGTSGCINGFRWEYEPGDVAWFSREHEKVHEGCKMM
ncbi:hypothetical protein FSARC_2600 [Fusarium sarcochroum]|uniref:Beta-lactamase-related domain-containing protein n=1 Tax=Fusarium sarcochroum TaxID=1208366 RepID=A0A8H4U6C0_9HYPO|nr:hypothetical protein FSARC_2600 [Fusarium sarcochroum]